MNKLFYVILLCLVIRTGVSSYEHQHIIPLTLPNVTSVQYIEQKLVTSKLLYDWNPIDFTKEIKCLADNIYFEGRGEKLMGKLAIGLVTINRVKHAYFPDSICGVVHQRGKSNQDKLVAQFSWTLDGLSDRPIRGELWNEIYLIATALTAEQSLSNFHDFTNGATHYHADYINPGWTDLKFLTKIGSHLFYRLKHSKKYLSVAAYM